MNFPFGAIRPILRGELSVLGRATLFLCRINLSKIQHPSRVHGENPINELKLVVYLTISMVLYILSVVYVVYIRLDRLQQ